MMRSFGVLGIMARWISWLREEFQTRVTVGLVRGKNEMGKIREKSALGFFGMIGQGGFVSEHVVCDQDERDERWMRVALEQARLAMAAGEVPIGAVLVRGEEVVAVGRNRVEELKDAMAHAEMLVMREAQRIFGDWRLEDCVLYVTKEPCPMCAGAIVHCRPPRVVFGCRDAKAGAAGGWVNLLQSNPPLNHACELRAGVLEEECVGLVQTFFREAREKKKAAKLARRLADEACQDGAG